MDELGLDVSNYQDTNFDLLKQMWDLGYRFIYIRFSAGSDYIDKGAPLHYTNAMNLGFAVGPYMFVKADQSGIDQYNTFVNAVGDRTFQLPPAMDTEMYNAIDNRVTRAIGRLLGKEVGDVIIEKELRYGEPSPLFNKSGPLSLSYPSESIVDVIGMRLKGFKGFNTPAIYTNPSSGNVIYHTPKMAKYLLWIANWGVNYPNLPAIWKSAGETPFIWQSEVKRNLPINPVDHDVWMNKYPFPGTTPTPTPAEISANITIKNGNDIYSGLVTLPKTN